MGQYINDGTVKWIIDDVRFNMPVGVVFYDSYLHDGCVKYNGATVQREDYIRLEKIANDKNLWTENSADEPWKFGVGDGSTTMTLPDFRNRFIEGGDSVQVLEAGLPNITGQVSMGGVYSLAGQTNCFKNSKNRTGSATGATHNEAGGNQKVIVDFSATNSNSIYGASSTVQPPAFNLIAQIKY